MTTKLPLLNLLLLANVSQNDIEYLESKGDTVIYYEIAKKALVLAVPADFPADSLTLLQLKNILSGETADWSSLGGEYPISVHYDNNIGEEYLEMLDAVILKGVPLTAPAMREHEVATNTSRHTIMVNAPYDNAPGSLGIFDYNDAPAENSFKILMIDGVMPSEETILRSCIQPKKYDKIIVKKQCLKVATK